MTKKRIAIIGPVYPFKGGIAHYTSLLCRNLSEKHETMLVSYSMQYPKLLYPGKEQKDFENDRFKIEGAQFLINTIDPFSWTKAVRAIREFAPDAVVVQWWHPYFSLCYRSLAARLKRFTKVVFICHNVIPHEGFPFARFLTKRTLKLGAFHIVHSKEDENDLLSILPQARYRRGVHPTYDAFNSNSVTGPQARKRLSLPENGKVLLFFGFIREYKGLKFLLKAMPEIVAALPDIRLLVVGDFFGNTKGEYEALIAELGIGDRLILHDQYVPDHEVELYFKAADLVALPYTSATQSGIVQIAYGFGKPVVVTNVGGLPDVVDDAGTGYVVEPEDPSAIAQAVIRYFRESREAEFSKNIEKKKEIFSWDRLRETIENYLESGDGHER